jgi:NADH:ubiquinone oxidoreductase subunit B-like Fe-S oxidoreductase
LLTTVEKVVGYARKSSVWPGTFGLPGCPPRPEMLLDSILKLHDKIQNMKLGANREAEIEEQEQARLRPLLLLT